MWWRTALGPLSTRLKQQQEGERPGRNPERGRIKHSGAQFYMYYSTIYTLYQERAPVDGKSDVIT